MSAKTKIITATIITALLLATLAGCRADALVGGDGETDAADFTYAVGFIPLPSEITDVRNLAYFEGKAYFTATTGSAGFDEFGNLSIGSLKIAAYSINLDGTELTVLDSALDAASDITSEGETLQRDRAADDFTGEGDEIAELLDWQDFGIMAQDVDCVVIISDERFICSFIAQDMGFAHHELAVFTKVPKSEAPQKTVLKLAVFEWMDSRFHNAVAYFNRTSAEHYIEVVTYEDLDKLTLDLTTGSVPDLMHIGIWTPYDDYVSSGLFEDLYPYIDADPRLGREDFVQSALRGAEVDGRLYSFAPGFYIYTIFANPSVVGPGAGWSLDDFEAILNERPEADAPLADYENKASFLWNMIRVDRDAYIDMESGEVHFDTVQFMQLLKLSDRFPVDYIPSGGNITVDDSSDKNLFSEGRAIASPRTFGGLADFADEKAKLGGDIVIKGWPSIMKSAHDIRVTEDCFAIIAQSPNKDAAWSFIKILMCKDWQEVNVQQFPTNKEAFDRRIAIDRERLEKNDSGANPSGTEITDSDIEMILHALDSATNPRYFDRALGAIIREEVTNYASGANTAEQTARFLQSRVSLFVSERR